MAFTPTAVSQWNVTFTDRGTTSLASVNTTTSTNKIYIQPLKDVISNNWDKSGIEALLSCYALYTDHATLNNDGKTLSLFSLSGVFDKSKIDIDWDTLLIKLNSSKYRLYQLTDNIKLQFSFGIKDTLLQGVSTGYSYFTYNIQRIIKSSATIGDTQMQSFDLEDYVFAPIISNNVWYGDGLIIADVTKPTLLLPPYQVVTSFTCGLKFAYQKGFATSYKTAPVLTTVVTSVDKGSVTYGTKPELTFTNTVIPFTIIPADYDLSVTNYCAIQEEGATAASQESPTNGFSSYFVPGTSTKGSSSDINNTYNNFTGNIALVVIDKLLTYIPYDPLRSNVVNNIELSTTQMDLVTSWTYQDETETYATVLSPDPDSTTELIYTSDVPQLR